MCAFSVGGKFAAWPRRGRPLPPKHYARWFVRDFARHHGLGLRIGETFFENAKRGQAAQKPGGGVMGAWRCFALAALLAFAAAGALTFLPSPHSSQCLPRYSQARLPCV